MNIENYADAILAKKMLEHRGHKLALVTYGVFADNENVALECTKCGEVIHDYEITADDLTGEFSDVLNPKEQSQ